MEKPEGPNIELLAEAIAWAEANPERWNQGTWAQLTDCGTCYCIGGYIACKVVGARPNLDSRLRGQTHYCEVTNANGVISTEFIEDVARIALRISAEDASRLFDPHNTLEDLKYYLGELERLGCLCLEDGVRCDCPHAANQGVRN